MKRMAAATIAVRLAVAALPVACATPAKLTAEEIVARNVDARGGLEEWRKIKTMVWTGRVTSNHLPAPGLQFTLEQKRPNKTRMQINAPGEKSVRVFNGAQGWRMRMAHGQPEVQPFTPQEVSFAQTGHGIDGPLIDYAAKGNSVTLQGVDELVDELGARKAYHLSLRLAKGGTEDIWVNAENWLEIRYDRMADGPSGAQRRVSTTYGDYHTVEGLKIPFVIETGGGAGATPDKLLLDRVVLNAPLEDSTFGNPANPLSRNPMPGFAPRFPGSKMPSTEVDASGDRGSARQ